MIAAVQRGAYTANGNRRACDEEYLMPLVRTLLRASIVPAWLATITMSSTAAGDHFSFQIDQIDQIGLLLEAVAQGRPVDGTFKDRQDFAKQFRAGAHRWIEQAPVPDKVRRRNVVALAALELSTLLGTGNRDQVVWPEALFAEGRPTEFERLWRLAVLTQVSTGTYEVDNVGSRGRPFDGDPFAEAMTKRVLVRFPDDARFRLLDVLVRRPAVSVLCNEPGAPPGVLLAVRTSRRALSWAPPGNAAQAKQQLRDAIRELAALQNDPEIGPEVHLRIGILRYHLNELDTARAELAIAANTSVEQAVRHVANYVTGLSFDAQQRFEEAMLAFNAAAHEKPDDMATARQRSVHLFLVGRADEVPAVIGRAFTPTPPTASDPALVYRMFEARFYRERLRRLHEMVRP